MSALELLPLPMMLAVLTALLYGAGIPLWGFTAAGALLYGGLSGWALAREARRARPRGLEKD